MFPPDTLPVAETMPPVDKLPLLVLPVTVNDVNVPTDVTFGCAAVVNVPVNNEAPIVPELA